MMTATEVFRKTMIFCWLKLLLGGVLFVASLVLLGICLGIGALFGTNVGLIMFFIWLGGIKVLHFILMHYAGYILKAGHVAIIAEAVTTGEVPPNQVALAKERVAERFGTSNVYFLLDRLVGGAVRQLQNVVGRVGRVFEGIPGAKAVISLAQFFLSIALGYVDECCLGYTFYKKDQSPFKSAADGVAIYFQNWKALLKNAAVTMAVVVGGCFALVVVFGLLFGAIVKVVGGSGLIAFGLALMCAWIVKFAFIDSYILVSMMTTFMQVAPSTELSFDLYQKLCGLSGKFRELFDKGKSEAQPQPQADASPLSSDGL